MSNSKAIQAAARAIAKARWTDMTWDEIVANGHEPGFLRSAAAAIEAAAPIIRAEVERGVVEYLRSHGGLFPINWAECIERGDHRKGVDR